MVNRGVDKAAFKNMVKKEKTTIQPLMCKSDNNNFKNYNNI